MRNDRQIELESLGLPTAEAQVYLALLQNGGTLGASALAAAVGITRTNIYPVLSSLANKGLVEAEAGYGSRFTAVRPKEALSALIAREKHDLLERERRVDAVSDQLESLIEAAPTDADAEQIQVIRDPRVATDRFERLQLEAEREIDLFVKYPIFNVHEGNPGLSKAVKRGVHYRTVYEQAILDAPEIKPCLAKWIEVGEEARAYDGALPHKLAIFDRQNILLPLVTPGRPARTLYIRHPQLGASLRLLFDSFWNAAKPIPTAKHNKTERVAGASARQKPPKRVTGPAESVDQQINGAKHSGLKAPID